MFKRFLLQLISTIVVFILINTAYFWEGKLGIGAILVFLILFCIIFILLIEYIRQIYNSIRDKFSLKDRNILIIVMGILLALIGIKPLGIIKYDILRGKDVLIAEREGAANCMIYLKLKDTNNFTYESFCFGINRSFGKYKIEDDTIYFADIDNNFEYNFAVIRTDTIKNNVYKDNILMYRNKTDKKPLRLFNRGDKLEK